VANITEECASRFAWNLEIQLQKPTESLNLDLEKKLSAMLEHLMACSIKKGRIFTENDLCPSLSCTEETTACVHDKIHSDS